MSPPESNMIRVDFRSSHVHYLNNLEEDAMYKRWRNNINEVDILFSTFFLLRVIDGFVTQIYWIFFHADFDACLPWTATLYPQEPVSCCLRS